jgi:HAD superfamily hydrolase (TIGR01509 family)
MDFLSRQYWIFDLDGTLTQPIHNFAAIRQELGIPAGKDILEALAELPETEACEKHAVLKTIEIELSTHATPARGVHACLEELRKREVTMGILTRNTRHNAWIALEAIGLECYFSHSTVLGREEARPKPDADGINKLIQYWNIQNEQTVMIGDFLYDLQAGKNAGSATIHVDSSGSFPWPEYMDCGVHSFEELYLTLTTTPFPE